jgi:hypothetical protein
VFSLLGAYVTQYAVPVPVLQTYLGHFFFENLSWHTLHDRFFSLFSMLKLNSNLFSRLQCFIFFLAIFYYFVCKKKSSLDKRVIFLNYFIIFSLLGTLFLVCFISYEVVDRYCFPLFFLPILLFFYSTKIFQGFHFVQNTALLLACSAILSVPLYILVLIHRPAFKIKTEYYPKYMTCIDQALHGLDHHGIAQYWDARIISMLSKENLQISPLVQRLEVFPWWANLQRFENSNSFAIIVDVKKDNLHRPSWKGDQIKGLDQKFIENYNGKPKKTVICGPTKLLIYPKDKLKIPFLKKAGDQYTWLASQLPSQFTDNVVANSRVASESTAAGFLTFGPYIVLPEGRYQFSIAYSSQAPVTTQVAHWESALRDVTKAPPKEEIRADGALFGTEGRDKTLEGSFSIPKRFAKNVTEVRVFFLGKKNLTVRSLTIKKV